MSYFKLLVQRYFQGQRLFRSKKINTYIEFMHFCCIQFYEFVKIKTLFFKFLIVFLVEPNTIIIPIVSWIFGFPVLALLIICYLRRRAKLARERARQSNCDFENQVNLSLVRLTLFRRFNWV